MKKILINGGPEYIEFDPADATFIKRFRQLGKDIEAKRAGYYKLYSPAEIDACKELDAKLSREMSEWVGKKIDHVFGKGASQKVCGDTPSMSAFSQFLDGIAPYLRTSPAAKVGKQYTHHPQIKKRRK